LTRIPNHDELNSYLKKWYPHEICFQRMKKISICNNQKKTKG
jgi:hypothetical protein